MASNVRKLPDQCNRFVEGIPELTPTLHELPELPVDFASAGWLIACGNRDKGLIITAKSSVPAWSGERMDHQMAVEAPIACE